MLNRGRSLLAETPRKKDSCCVLDPLALLGFCSPTWILQMRWNSTHEVNMIVLLLVSKVTVVTATVLTLTGVLKLGRSMNWTALFASEDRTGGVVVFFGFLKACICVFLVFGSVGM